MAHFAASEKFNRHRYVRQPNGRWLPMADAGILTKYYGAYTHIPDAAVRNKFEQKHEVIQSQVYYPPTTSSPSKVKRHHTPPPSNRGTPATISPRIGHQDVRKRFDKGIQTTVYHGDYHGDSLSRKAKNRRPSPPPPPLSPPPYPFGRQDVRRALQWPLTTALTEIVYCLWSSVCASHCLTFANSSLSCALSLIFCASCYDKSMWLLFGLLILWWPNDSNALRLMSIHCEPDNLFGRLSVGRPILSCSIQSSFKPCQLCHLTTSTAAAIERALGMVVSVICQFNI